MPNMRRSMGTLYTRLAARTLKDARDPVRAEPEELAAVSGAIQSGDLQLPWLDLAALATGQGLLRAVERLFQRCVRVELLGQSICDRVRAPTDRDIAGFIGDESVVPQVVELNALDR